MSKGKLYDGNDRFCKIVAPEHHLSLADQGLCKWPQKRIGYFEQLNLSGMSRDDVAAVYDLAWRQWEQVCDIEPVRLPGSDGSNIWAVQGSIDGPWGTLATSYLPCGAQQTTQLIQRFDDGETWNDAFFLAVACHEIGHALGLSHLSEGNLMAPILSESIRAPQAGDIAEIQSRYGPAGVQPTPTPTPTPEPTPTPTPTPIPGNLPLDGQYREYVLGPGREERYPFHVSGSWFRPRTWFRVSTHGSSGFTPTITLYGRLGKTLAREDYSLAKKLYEGDYSIGVQDMSGRGGPFRMAAKLG